MEPLLKMAYDIYHHDDLAGQGVLASHLRDDLLNHILVFEHGKWQSRPVC